MKSLAHQIRRFGKQEDGLVMTEFLIMLPLLVWTFMALFIYWDAFRMINQAQKASYSISDLISRQSNIDATFVNGTQTVMEYFVGNSPAIRVRITSAKYNETTNRYTVLFSRSPGNRMPQLTNTNVNQTAFRARLPITANQHSVVIVETEVSYTPGFEVGIPAHTFDNFIVTRPRYDRQVCYTGLSCPAVITS